MCVCDSRMAGWAGFSDEELKKLKQLKDPAEFPDRQRKPPSTNKSRQQLQRERALKQQRQKPLQDGSFILPPEQQLSRPSCPPEEQHSRPGPQLAVNQSCPPTASTLALEKKSGEHDNHKQGQIKLPATEERVCPLLEERPADDSTKELEKEEVELKERSRLEQLQLEQRLMEEKNKRKKALIAKAIAERSKRTQAETVKLKRIQQELQHLDSIVSTDIGILRDRIEQASWDYSCAMKRFVKAEAEYVAAKLNLHKKTELKEQLTEHLCTIIQQNELRKAKKLEELMQQLEVETDEERLELEIEVERMLQQQEAEEAQSKSGGSGTEPLQDEQSSTPEIKSQQTEDAKLTASETVTEAASTDNSPSQQMNCTIHEVKDECNLTSVTSKI